MIKSAYLLFAALFGFSTVQAGTFKQVGTATYYGRGFYHRFTSSGERYSKDSLTAAHRSLPFGTIVRVTALKSKKSVLVKINDRGPRSRKRIIDLSVAAARQLGILRAGVAKVKVELVKASARPSRHQPKVKKPEAQPVAQPAPAIAQAKDTNTGPFGLQTGAFRDHDNALHAQEVLSALGFQNSNIELIQSHTAKLYRVYLGPFCSMTEADDIIRKLKAQHMESFLFGMKED